MLDQHVFHEFLSFVVCCFLCFFFFLKSSIQNTFRNFIRVSNSLDPDQERINFGPDLGQNCFQTETAHLLLCMLGTLYTSFYCLIFVVFFPSLKLSLPKNFSGILLQYQIVWTQIRPDLTSGLIWVRTVCKGHQHTTLASDKEFLLSAVFFCLFS